MSRRSVLLCVVFALCVTASVESAVAPSTVNYQAVLTSGGTPVTAPVTVTFTIYDAESGGTPVWTETRSVTPDALGRVSVRLGEQTALSSAAFAGPNRWLGVQVGGDLEMTPRMPLSSSSYALRTATIDGATGGNLEGDLVLHESAIKDFAASSAQIILVNLNGDSTIIDPNKLRMVDNLGVEQVTMSTNPITGPALGIADPGGNVAGHTAAASSYSRNVSMSKNPEALRKLLEVSADGVTKYDEATGVPVGSLRQTADGGELELAADLTTKAASSSVRLNRNMLSYTSALGQPVIKLDAVSGYVSGRRATFGLNNNITITSTKGANGEMLNPDPGLVAGDNNTLSGANASAIGDWNTVGGTNSIALGWNNTVNGHNSLIGGFDNFSAGNQVTMIGDSNYVAFGQAQVVCFGEADSVTYSAWGSILGGRRCILDTGAAAVIAGGWQNKIRQGFASVVGGGQDNTIQGAGYGTISGGIGNRIHRDDAGGIDIQDASIGGGRGNRAANGWATVAGGYSNSASGSHSVIAGGSTNIASGHQSVVSGGIVNTAGPGNGSVVGGGESNIASGNWSTIPGGYGNDATGAKSFAAGNEAQAVLDGAFVWADASGGTPFATTAINQFLIKAGGGVGINTNSPTSTLHVDGAIATKVVSITADHTMGSEAIVMASPTISGLTVSLPDPSTCEGRQITVKKINGGGGSVTVSAGTGAIDGVPTYVLAVQYDFVCVISDGNDWFIVAR